MKKLNSLLLFFGLVTAIGIAFLLRPERMGDASFALVILWLSILVISNWFISTYVFTNVKSNKQSTNFGVLPSLHFVVFLYSVYSISLLLVAYWLNDYQTLPAWHWVLQLLGFGLCTSIFVLILISSKTAEEIERSIIAKPSITDKKKDTANLIASAIYNNLDVNIPQERKEEIITHVVSDVMAVTFLEVTPSI